MAKKKNIYLCVDVKTHTEKSIMHVGDSRQGVLSMQNDFLFDFVEESAIHWKRNPKVWCGKYINVHRDKQGNYQVHFRRMQMCDSFNVLRVMDAICMELLTAKRVLGL